MNSVQIGLIIAMAYFSVYGIVNRICCAAEKCAYYHAVAESEKGVNNGKSGNEKSSQD